MKQSTRPRRTSRSTSSLWRKLHRWLGLATAAAVIWLAVTGILLNHSQDLALDKRYLGSAKLAHALGMQAPQSASYFKLAEAEITQLGNQWYWNTQAIAATDQPLVGAASTAMLSLVANNQQAWLLDHDGNLIETINSWPGATKLGIFNQQFAITSPQGELYSSLDLLEWAKLPLNLSNNVQWASPSTAPTVLIEQLQSQWLAQHLSWEQVILLAHNGHLFGKLGPWLLDLFAIALILLTLIGLYLWWRGYQRKRQRRRHQLQVSGKN